MTDAPGKRAGTRPWAVAVVLVVGLLGTTLGSAALARESHTRAAVQIEARAREAGERVDASVRRAFAAAVAVRARVAEQPDLSADEFRRFVRDGGILSSFPLISALSFARWVPPEELVAYASDLETRTGQSPGVHPDVPAGEGAVVVELIEPLVGNETAVGFALTSETSRREAVERARDRGVPIVSAPIRLVQDGGEPSSVLLLVPVYRGQQSQATGPERRRAFLGVASIVLRAEVLLSGVLPLRSTIDLQVLDVGPVELDGSGEPTVLLSTAPARADGPRASVDLNVGDRRWRLVATPNERFPSETPAWLIMAVAGAVLTSALAGLVNTQRSARDHAEALVAERTDELRIANEELVQANRAKSTFLSTVSHELRTPLAAIIGFVALLDRHADRLDDAARKDMLQRVDRNAQGLHRLIEELLAYSRLEDAGLVLHRTDLDLGEAVARALDALTPVTESATIRRHLAPGIISRVDPQAHDRILTNLITNAVKYGGSHVTIDVTVAAANGMATLVVSDDGVGIPQVDLERVFEQFERGADHTTVAGTGIGLTIVRDLARRHGGDVLVESEAGAGATFTVTLPLAQMPPGEAGASPNGPVRPPT